MAIDKRKTKLFSNHGWVIANIIKTWLTEKNINDWDEIDGFASNDDIDLELGEYESKEEAAYSYNIAAVFLNGRTAEINDGVFLTDETMNGIHKKVLPVLYNATFNKGVIVFQ